MSFDLKIIDGKLVIKNGSLDVVENSDKLVQDVLKMITTPIQSLPLIPGYGSLVTQAFVGTSYDSEFIDSLASQQLRQSLETMMKSQMEQLKINQIVTPHEQIAAIESIKVSQNLNDPRRFLINLIVISKAFQRIPVYFEIAQ